MRSPRLLAGAVLAAASLAAPTALAAPASATVTAIPAASKPLRGKVIVLDPGHNGRNWTLPASCNTTGTQTPGGYPEHAHNWDVALRARARLQALGARVVLTRSNDTGAGPCARDRGPVAGRVHADLLVSIHSDGAPSGLRGFHVIWAGSAQLAPAQRAADRRLATALRDAFRRGTVMRPASYAGDGLGTDERSDLATLNTSTRPAALLEIGNMRNPADARLLRSASFRETEAAAIVSGIRGYLHR